MVHHRLYLVSPFCVKILFDVHFDCKLPTVCHAKSEGEAVMFWCKMLRFDGGEKRRRGKAGDELRREIVQS